MYCFSNLCRICLKSYTNNYTELKVADNDGITLYEKMIFCIPELFSSLKNLPENVCCSCNKFIEEMYKFKQMSIENMTTLKNYAVQLKENSNISEGGNNLVVEVKRVQYNKNLDENDILATDKEYSRITKLLSSKLKSSLTKDFNTTLGDNLDKNTKYSISLNQWDLFEAKYTCQCPKEFTESTEHLCKSCEGELLGFRLSRSKFDNVEDRCRQFRQQEQLKDNFNSNFSVHYEIDNLDSSDYEKGFNYNDIMLSQVHLSELRKEIKKIELDIYRTENNVDTVDNINNTSLDNNLSPKNSILISPSIKSSNNLKENVCPICKRNFARKYYLNNHFLTHTGSKLYECEKCTKRYIYKDEFDKHLLSHARAAKKRHNENIYELSTPVNSIDKSLRSDTMLSKIKSENSLTRKSSDLNSSDEIHVCSTCDKFFSSKSCLAVHLMTHFGKKDFKCSVCGKEFFRKEILDEHIQNSHNNGSLERKFKCPYCDKCYNHSTNVRRHMRESHAVINFPCSKCNTNFTQKNLLEKHIAETHTEKKEEKPVVCSYCSKIFSDKNNLRMHLESHTESVEDAGTEFNYCDICDKNYSKKTNMKKHMRTHNRDRIFVCRICSKNFDNRWVLHQHLKLDHEGENTEYKCTECFNIYKSKYSLNKHIKSHTK